MIRTLRTVCVYVYQRYQRSIITNLKTARSVNKFLMKYYVCICIYIRYQLSIITNLETELFNICQSFTLAIRNTEQNQCYFEAI